MPSAQIARLWGPVLLVMALIFGASSVPNPDPLPGNISDKLAHLGIYALLGVTIVRALAEGQLARVRWRHVAAAVALSALYGALDELHQTIVPGRSPDWRDLVADASGALVGGMLAVGARVWLVRRAPAERYTRGE